MAWVGIQDSGIEFTIMDADGVSPLNPNVSWDGSALVTAGSDSLAPFQIVAPAGTRYRVTVEYIDFNNLPGYFFDTGDGDASVWDAAAPEQDTATSMTPGSAEVTSASGVLRMRAF